jgi:hypothetical protein
MKRFLIFSLLFSFLSTALWAKDKPLWSYSIRINGLKDTVCYWGYHYGDKQYVRDTARVDSKGLVVFEGNKELEGGIYLVIMPNKKYIEVILNGENNFSLETDTADVVRNMKVKGSKENELFYQYLVFINDRQKETEPVKRRLDKVKDNKDSTAFYKSKLEEINKALYRAEQSLLTEQGLPRRPWYKHTLYAPGFYTGYGVKTMPGIREAIEQRDWKEAQEQINIAANAIGRLAEHLKATSMMAK